MNEQTKDVRKKLPFTTPRNSLKLESCMLRTSFVPPSTAGLEFISSTAASIATFATLPMTELKVKIAPMFTASGLEETFMLIAFDNIRKQRTNSPRSQTTFIVVMKEKSRSPNYMNMFLNLSQTIISKRRDQQTYPKAKSPSFFQEHKSLRLVRT